MSNKAPLSFSFLVFLSLLTGCCQPFGVQSSGIDIPENWNTLSDNFMDGPLVVDDNAIVEQNWWKNFGDPTLDVLLELAVENNKTLAIAKARIEEVRADQTAAFFSLLPQVDFFADASRGNQGFYTGGLPLSYADLNIQSSWELDLFGKNQARLSAATTLIQSAEAMRQSVLVKLLADVARTYFDIRNFERQIAITQENLESQKQTLKLTREQLLGGLASDFDVQRAAAQVSTTESILPEQQISFAVARNRLNVLLGSVPGEYDALLNTKVPLLPLDFSVIISAPATVLATRPDVREAERRFAASISQHIAATRELFPTVNLLSFFGVQWATVFNTSPTWNVAANLTQPLLNFGRIQAAIEATDARQMQEFLNYQQTVLEALEDMESALTNYMYETSRNISLTRAAEENRKAMELSHQQYTNGYSGLLDVLIVQRNALLTESSKATSDAKLRKDLVNIYTASGGGWAY